MTIDRFIQNECNAILFQLQGTTIICPITCDRESGGTDYGFRVQGDDGTTKDVWVMSGLDCSAPGCLAIDNAPPTSDTVVYEDGGDGEDKLYQAQYAHACGYID